MLPAPQPHTPSIPHPQPTTHTLPSGIFVDGPLPHDTSDEEGGLDNRRQLAINQLPGSQYGGGSDPCTNNMAGLFDFGPEYGDTRLSPDTGSADDSRYGPISLLPFLG